MNSTSPTETSLQTRWEAWDRFWFKPSDPSLVGLIRLLCGAITLYTTFAYTFRLPDWIGENGWYNLESRMKVVRHRAMYRNSLFGAESQVFLRRVTRTKRSIGTPISRNFASFLRRPTRQAKKTWITSSNSGGNSTSTYV